MFYGSVCSGIEAATVAWEPLGWKAAFYSEVEPFPCSVLQHHYPQTPNYGDMTKYKEWPNAAVDVLVGGTPCQSFSIAGLRKGLNDPRGNLMLVFGAVASRYRPAWLVWENVPGVLSSNGGRDFGTLLGMLGELGYGFAYRVFDAQYVRVESHRRAVPQRRRRVFVVGYLGDWRPPAAVLFERESLSGNPPPRREERKESAEVAGTLAANGGGLNRPAGNCNELDFCAVQPYPVANYLTQRMHKGINSTVSDGQTPVIAFPARMSATQCASAKNISCSLRAMNPTAIASAQNQAAEMQVRLLTPVECERLQGFPDNYTKIPWRNKPADQCLDRPRYKALGNSMATNVMRYIGDRIELVNKLLK